MSNTFLNSAAVAALLLCTAPLADAASFDVPGGSLEAALDIYSRQSGMQLVIPNDQLKGARSSGVHGELPPSQALSRILSGTGFVASRDSSGLVGIVRDQHSQNEITPIQLAQATPPVTHTSVETVTVTSSKLGGADVQSIPIAITALSQEQLTAQKIEGGPDLLKSVPNMTFTKTNFTGYNVQIRGVGTQAISVTTDPAVAVAFNEVPFIRNHFFEQEFFDVAAVETLRGPQGTLYGRNATGGVINITTAKATDQFEGNLKAEFGNFSSKRVSGMLNLPIWGDKLDLRVAGALTDRKGYDYNEITEHHVNGRKLWSTRVTLSGNPVSRLHFDATWERFNETDDRSRTGKQLCHRDAGPESLGSFNNLSTWARAYLSTGCKPGSLYDDAAFGTPNGLSLPYVQAPMMDLAAFKPGGLFTYTAYPVLLNGSRNPAATNNTSILDFGKDPYGGQMQSTDLRTIASRIDPVYRAQSDTFTAAFNYDLTPQLRLYSSTGYNKDRLYSRQDYNRFNTFPVFKDTSNWYVQAGSIFTGGITYDPSPFQGLSPKGIYCDPQLGCSDTMMAMDISQQKSTQFSQEVRLASSFEGRFNFNVGANYLRYKTHEDYYVLNNMFTIFASAALNQSPVMGACPVSVSLGNFQFRTDYLPWEEAAAMPNPFGFGCMYVDTNPVDKIDGDGHNYFRSENPYRMHSYSAFGEAYYQLTDDLKFTGGLRFTSDHKTFTPILSQLLLANTNILAGYVNKGSFALPDIKQGWNAVTGRAGVNWTPDLSFTDQTMVYAFYSRGYKAGGANPPGIGFNPKWVTQNAGFPPTFKPEYVNAYEIGTKNLLLDGALTLNGGAFFYDYKNYQLSKIVDRTAANENFDARIWGLEGEAVWEPLPGLRFNMSTGFQGSRVADGAKSIDIMDRTAGNPDYVTMKGFLILPSNCVISKAKVLELIARNRGTGSSVEDYRGFGNICPGQNQFPVTSAGIPLNPNDPAQYPNGGQGIYKELGGNELPNTPHLTLSLGAQYSMALNEEWAATARTDFYWQTNSWARVYNYSPYDVLHGWSNLNLTLNLARADGLQLEAYVKNVFDKTSITGAFLNSDDSGLTTNVFTTDPRLIGFSITKSF